MNMPPMDERYIPIENDDYVPLQSLALDGTPTTSVEIAIQEQGETRPLTGWTTYPGPKTPTARGVYYVFVRATGSTKPAICLGRLIMF